MGADPILTPERLAGDGRRPSGALRAARRRSSPGVAAGSRPSARSPTGSKRRARWSTRRSGARLQCAPAGRGEASLPSSTICGRRTGSPRPGRADGRRVLISVVIPVYNGARTIGPLVERLVEALPRDRAPDRPRRRRQPRRSDDACRALSARHPGVVTYVKLGRQLRRAQRGHGRALARARRLRGDHGRRLPEPARGGGAPDRPRVPPRLRRRLHRTLGKHTTGSAISAAA